MPDDSVRLRTATPGDLDLVKRTLYIALAWDPDDPIPPMDVAVGHPQIAVYHEGWMRPGDGGVVAEAGGEFVGMAYCRRFTEDGGGQGFYDEETPELAVGVVAGRRALGIGERLIRTLSAGLSAAGVARMSLSVASANPALRLYRRLGYREVRRHGDGIVMVADL